MVTYRILASAPVPLGLTGHDASSSDTEMSTFFSGDDATQQTLSRDLTELRKVQISIEGLAILTLGAGEK